MTEYQGARDAQSLKRYFEQVCLCIWGPNNIAWTIAVSEARPVENDDPICLRSQFDETTRLEILDHAAVTVKQDQRLPFATLDVVQPDAINFKEAPTWGVLALRLCRQVSVHECRRH